MSTDPELYEDVEDVEDVEIEDENEVKTPANLGGSSYNPPDAPFDQPEQIAQPMQQNNTQLESMTNERQFGGTGSSAQFESDRQANTNSADEPPEQYTTSYQPEPNYVDQSVDKEERVQSSRFMVVVFGILLIILLTTAAIVVPLYIKPKYNTLRTSAPTPTTESLPTEFPTQAPVPSMETSPPPTTSDFATFVQNFASTVSKASVFNDPTSPQYKAAEFIANDSNYTSTIADDALMGDLYAIVVFYYSTGGDHWYDCSRESDNCPGIKWLTSDVTHCDWNWVFCNEAGRVVDLVVGDIDGNNLTGTLTPELGLLKELEQFAVVHNKIEGKLPDEIGALEHVSHFLLANNSMSGTIPGTFLENSPMEVFMVSDNKFKGDFPKSLTNMSSIFQIFLENNRFMGPIPEEFGLLPNLATLDLSGNRFTGEIPDSIFSISMQNLYLGGGTGIDGNISSAIGEARNLVRLHITNTKISGGIPSELFELPFLTEVVLSNNTLTGELSASVANLGGSLRTLKLDGNNLSGDLPNVAFNELAISNVLAFDRNSFTGAISPDVCRRKGDGYYDLQIVTADCEEVTCSCCNNCPKE